MKNIITLKDLREIIEGTKYLSDETPVTFQRNCVSKEFMETGKPFGPAFVNVHTSAGEGIYTLDFEMQEASLRRKVRVVFQGGGALETEINGTPEEIAEYYATDKEFNLGSGEDDNLQKVAYFNFID